LNTTLVTGGAGYVGSHTVEALLEAGRRVVVLDDLSTGHVEVSHLFDRLYGPSLFVFEQADLCVEDEVRRVFDKHQPDQVIDFTAKSLVGESQEVPRVYFDTNVVGFRNLIRAANGIPIVKSTTAATYGEPRAEDLPLTEGYQDWVLNEGRFSTCQLMPAKATFEELLDWYTKEISEESAEMALDEHDIARLMIPTNVYGITKMMDELILAKAWSSHKAPYTAFRYFNVAGASLSALIGEDHTPESHLIPLAIQAALGLRDPLTVFGTDYATHDGTAVRDYVSVKELATAHINAVDRMASDPGAYTYNLGTKAGFSVRDILDTVVDVSGKDVPCVEGERRVGDPERLVADPSLVEQDLGWVASESLAETVESAWRWHSGNPRGFRPVQEERYNPFWGRWITFAASRGSRPWEGAIEARASGGSRIDYDEACYLCPGNTRTSGAINPYYDQTFVFPNDFPSMVADAYEPAEPGGAYNARSSTGVCEVIVYSRDHSARMATMSTQAIEKVVDSWIDVYDRLSQQPEISYVLVFENRGAVMGNSQLHPHGQVYAYGHIPDLMVKQQIEAFETGDFVSDTIDAELGDGRRIVYSGDAFCAFVPFAAWLPYDICLVPRRPLRHVGEMNAEERHELAVALQTLSGGLDQLFGQPYQYSLALIQAPTDGSAQTFHFQIHISSLLRGPEIRKHIVGTDIFGRSVNPSDPNVSAAEVRKAINRYQDTRGESLG